MRRRLSALPAAALLLAGLLWTAPAAAGAVDDAFALPADLAGHAVLSCLDLELAGGSVVTSEGLRTGAAEGGGGHVRANGDVRLDGGPEVHGDAIAGPGRQVILSGQPATVTGEQRSADVPFDCTPVDLAALAALLEGTNDNASLPQTAKGRPPLGGADGRELSLTGKDTLTIPAGTYLLSGLELTGNSKIVLDGDVRILVTGEIDLKGGSHVHLDGDPYRLRLWSSGAEVSITSHAILHGHLYAPYAEVRLAGIGKVVGGVHGGEVTIVGGSRVRRVVDDAAPSLVVDTPQPGQVVDSCEVVVQGIAGDGEGGVTVTVDGVPVDVHEDGSFAATTSLFTADPGLIAVVATDAAGNATRVEVRVEVAPPVITLASPAPGSLVGQRVVDLAGTSGNATSVTVDGVAAAVAGDGTWSLFGFDLGADGLVDLTLVAAHCTRAATATAVLDLDTLAPVVAIDSPAPGTLFGASPIAVSGTVEDAHLDTVTVNGVAAAVAAGRFTAEDVPLTEGTNTLTAVAIDALGRATTSAPVAVSLDTTAPTVTVTSPAGGTVVATPAITVDGEVSDPNLAEVRVNGVLATVDGTSFSAAGVPLAEGENFLVAEAVDAIGNSATSPSVVVVLDTLPPVVSLDAAALPALTEETAVTVSGTVSDPHLERVTVGGVVATVVGESWLAAGVPLAEGENVLVAEAVDTLGHAAESNPGTVVVDTLAPQVAIAGPADGAELASRTVTVTGTAADPHLDRVTVGDVEAVLDGGAFTVEGVELPEGESQIVARAVDLLGHAADSAPVNVVVDTLAPVVRLDSPLDPLVTTPAVTVTGRVDEPHLEAVTVAGIAAVVDAEGAFSVDGVPLAEGPNEITATASDTFGHVAVSEPVLYVLDTQAPAVTISSPQEGEVVESLAVTITGTAADPNLDTVTVNGVAATVGEDGSFTASVPLADGANTLVVVATDRAGHATEASVNVFLDSLPPGVSLDQPPPGACLAAGAPQTLGGVFADANPATGSAGQPPAVAVRVRTSDGAVSDHAGVLSAGGARWSVAGVDLGAVDGAATATVVATDVLGNAASAVASWRVDATAPVVTLTLDGAPFPGAAPGAAPPPGAQPVLLGRAVAAAVTVADGAAAAPPAAVLTLDGAPWTAGAPITAEGDHLLVATATDCAGRTGAAHALFRLDLTPPALVSSDPATGARRTAAVPAFSGVASEPLSAARVGGRPAAVSGAAFSLAGFAWKEGRNEVAVELVDLAGSRSTATVVFEVRTAPLTLEVWESGTPLTSGSVFLRSVFPELRPSDSSASVSATLDGAPFASGSEVAAGGPHQLRATATDGWGRTATAAADFEIDLAPGPTIEITAPADQARVTGPAIDVAGTVSGSGVTVEVDGVPATVAGGTWSLSGLPLEPDVPNDLLATATDTRGRTATAGVTVIVFSAAPQVLILDPADGTVTNRDRIDVSGVVVGGARYSADGTVRVAGTPVPVQPDGSFYAPDVPLSTGVNTLRAEVVDPQGRTGAGQVDVVADFTPPTIAFLAGGEPLADGAAFSAPVTLTIDVADDSGPPPVPFVRLNGALSDASASPRTSLAVADEGGYVVAVVALDAAGNEARAERSFILDFGGCALSDVHPAAGAAVSTATVTLAGRSGAAAAVAVRVPAAGGGFQDYPAMVADGTFLAGDVPLPVAGENALVLVCTDAAGGEEAVPHPIERVPAGDGPLVVITAPADGVLTAADTVTVDGTVTAGTVTVNGIPAAIAAGAGDDLFHAAGVPLVEGPNVLAARAVDAAGRTGADRVVVERDSQAPRVQITRPDHNTRLGRPGTGPAATDVSGLVDLDDEPNLERVTVSTAAGSVEATVDPASGAFVASGVPLDAAVTEAQTITVTAVDGLGHQGSSSVDVVLDAEGPAVVLDAPADLGFYGAGAPAQIAVSGDAWAEEGAALSINGIDLDPAGLAWAAAGADGRRHLRFSGSVALPAGEGPFGVIVRVTELDGGWAQDRRLLFRDTVPPEVVELVPADGTTGVAPDTLLLVLFSEPVRHSTLAAADGLTLSRAGGPAVVGTRTVSGQAVAFAPGAALAEGEDYVFRAGAAITDVAGNPLAAPAEAAFRVASPGATEAPLLDALPPVLCADEIVVAGSTSAGAAVEVRDGDLVFRGFADAAGRFTVTLPVSGSGYHLLRVRAFDTLSGAASPEASVVVRVDCSAPRVVDAAFDREAATIRVVFSEPIDPATVTVGDGTAAVRLADAEAPAILRPAVVTFADPLTALLALDPAPEAWWRERPVRLQVGPPAADVEGNPMAAVFETVFFPGSTGGLSGGFLFGEAYDDAGGRPLAGATAALYAAGAALPGAVAEGGEAAPLAATVTDGRGRYTFAGDVASGRYVLVVSAGGYAPVHRRLSLAPARGLVPFDVRLTPRAAAAGTLEPVAGGSAGAAGGALLAADPAALPGSDPVEVTLTARSPQGLPDFLPLGWTPAAAVELRASVAGTALAAGDAGWTPGGVTLELPLDGWVLASDPLVAVHHEPGAGRWRVLGAVERLGGAPERVRLAVPGPGDFAVVVADAEPSTAPPAAIEGEALAGVEATDAPDLEADLTLDPAVVPPTGRSAARVVARSLDGAAPWPSGLAVQAYLEEKLILAGGGGQLLEAPFSADVVLYHPRLSEEERAGAAPGSAGAAVFAVSPSPRAAQVLLDVGYENIRLFAFPEDIEREPAIGPTGGSVESPEGALLEVPEGALSAKVPVSVRLLPADELAALAPVAGYDTLAAARVELAGRTLTRAATLSLPVPPGAPPETAGDPRLILAERVDTPEDGRGSFPRLASRARVEAGRVVASPEQSGALPLDGVVREGLYLLLRAQAPLGYATGLVRGSSGLPLDLARVSADGLGTAGVSRLGGRYAVPVSAGTDRAVRGLHPTLDETAAGVVPSLAAGGVAALDLTVQVVPPTVVAVSPAAGAVEQPVGSEVSITFSEPLAAGSVGSGTIVLEVEGFSGLTVDGAVSLEDGVRVVFAPDRPLLPGRTFRARFGGGVADAGGTVYAGQPVVWSFSTSAVAVPGGQVHPERFHVRLPANGVAEIYGEPGALPATPSGGVAWVVTPEIEGPLADPLRDTFPAAADGSFTGTVGHPPDFAVGFGSRIWVEVFDSAGQLAAEFRLGPFETADGKGFVAPPGEAVSFTSAEGVEVAVPAGAFAEPTLVRVETLDPATAGVPTPEGLGVGGFVRVDFDGEAAESLRLAIPVPAGAAAGSKVFIGEPVRLPWGRRLKVLSLGRVVERPDGRYLSNDESLQPFAAAAATVAPSTASAEPGRAVAPLGRATAAALPASFRKSLMQELRFRSSAVWYYEQGASWSILAGSAGAFPLGLGGYLEAIYNKIADLWVYVPTPHDWNGGFILPVISDQPLEIVRRDTATGWILAEAAYDPIADADGVIEIGFLPGGPDRRPALTDARPFRLVRFKAPPEDVSEPLALEVAAEGQTGGNVVVSSSGQFGLAAGTGVALYDLTPALPADPEQEAASPVAGPTTTVCDPDQAWALGAMAGGDEMLLVVGPGDLDAATAGTFELQYDLPLVDLAGTPPEQVAKLTDLGPSDGCSSSTAGGYPRPLPVTFEQTQRSSRLIVRASAGLAAGHRFRLELVAETLIGEASQLPLWPDGPNAFEFGTRAVPGQPLAGMPAGEVVGDGFVARDMLKLGNLLLVATADGDLVSIDASDAVEAEGLTRHALLRGGIQSQARGLVTDGHNRVFYSGLFGTLWAVKAMRLEDIRAADEPCGSPPAWAAGLPCFRGIVGSARVAYSLGSQTDLTASEWLASGTMPSGTPMDMSVVVQDEKGAPLPLERFVEAYTGGALSALVPDDKGVYTFPVQLLSTLVRNQSGTVEPSLPPDTPPPAIAEWRATTCAGEEGWDRYQRVTVDNLTTGQTWSIDLENPWPDGGGDGSDTVTGIRARRGDRLQVRYNLRAIGHVAIMGSGVTVVDLNRFHGVTQSGQTPGGGQCGRRLGKYEGQEIEWPSCAPAGIELTGMAITPSVASLGTTGCDSGECRGAGRIEVYSPLNSVGVVHTGSEATAPGDLNPKAELAACLRRVGGLGVLLRDVVVASDVRWLHRGVDGDLDGTFSAPPAGFESRLVDDDLLLVSLGQAGIYAFSVGDRSVGYAPTGRALVGHLQVAGHTAFRLQVDPVRKLLFAGGTNTATGQPIIDVWDLASINGAPGLDYQPVPRATLHAAWSTNQLGIDGAGTGLIYTWDGEAGAQAVPFEPSRFVLAGLYRPEEDEEEGAGSGGGPIDAVDRPTSRFVPLGVPVRADAPDPLTDPEGAEEAEEEDERGATGAFKVRVALPGALGPRLTARVQSLRALPAELHLAEDDLGAAVALPGGPGWPESDAVVTLRRLGQGADEGSAPADPEAGPLGLGYHLYESVETVLLVADPRARRDYRRQDAPGTEADEEGQCRRCDWPAYLPDPEGTDPAADDVLELLAGAWVRVYLDPDGAGDADPAVRAATEEAVAWFGGNGANYPAPVGWAAVAGPAAAVPAPVQVALAEPASNAAVWNAGEAGVAVALTGGDLLLAAVDHRVEGRAMPFSFERVYRSGSLGYGPLGAAGWSSPLFASLRELPSGEVEYHDGRGSVWRFPPSTLEEPPEGYEADDAGSYHVAEGLYVRLQKLSGDQGWRLVSPQHGTAYFDAAGRLVEIGDRHFRGGTAGEQGSHVRLRYDPYGQLLSVVDDLGRRYDFEYHDDPAPGAEGGDGPRYGLLEKITDFVGRSVELEWDEERRLLEVRLPEVENPVSAYADFSYTGDGRPTLTYAYDPDPGVTSAETDTVALLHGDFAALRLASVTQPQFLDGAGGGPRVRFGYDPVSGRVDLLGFPTPGDTNTAGSVEWRVETAGGADGPGPAEDVRVRAPWNHEATYELTDGRISVHRETLDVLLPGAAAPAALPVETRYSYTGDGRLTETLHPDGGRRALCYADGEGGAGCPGGGGGGEGDRLSDLNVVVRIEEALDGSHGAADYTMIEVGAEYHEDNLLSQVTDGEGRPIETPVAQAMGEDFMRYTAEGVSARFDFDPYGRPERVAGGGAGAPVVGFEYGEDADGRASAGLVERIAQGEGGNLAFSRQFRYDDAYNVGEITTSFGSRAVVTHDDWDRAVREESGMSDGGPLAPVGYAACGEAAGTAVERAFDAAGHLVRERRLQDWVDAADGQVRCRWVETRYRYNLREQLVAVERTFVSDPAAAGGVITAPVEVLRLEYDELGRLREQRTAAQSRSDLVTVLSYDAAGRVSGSRTGAEGERRVAYDAMSRVVLRTDGDQGAWRGRFDSWGRLYHEEQPTGAVMRTRFNRAHQPVETQTFAGDPLTDPEAELLALTRFRLTSFGAVDRVVEELTTEGERRVTERRYDDSGRLVAEIAGPEGTAGGIDPAAARRQLEIEYEPFGGRVLARRYGGLVGAPALHEDRFVYLTDNRMPWPDRAVQRESVPGSSEGPVDTFTTDFQRDVFGRVLKATRSDGEMTEYRWDRSSPDLLRALTGAGTEQRYSRDGGGRVLHVERAHGRGHTRYAYDLDGALLRQVTATAGGAELWQTAYTYDSTGRVASVSYADGTSDLRTYEPDSMLATLLARDGVLLSFDYDPANRAIRVTPTAGSGPTLVDAGDQHDYDELSRPTLWQRGRSGTAAFDAGLAVAYPSYDLASRPASEVVGAREPLAWEYDVFSRPVEVRLPAGAGRAPGGAFAGFHRTYDTLDRLSAASGLGAGGLSPTPLGADWAWGGASRLYAMTTRGALGTGVRFGYHDGAGPQVPGYEPGDAASWKLGRMSWGAAGGTAPTAAPAISWGDFGFGWRGHDGSPADGAKIGREVLGATSEHGLLAGLGWTWSYDNAVRLTEAVPGAGDVTGMPPPAGLTADRFTFSYGTGDELLSRLREATGESEDFTSGDYGRIATRDGVAFAYDGVGRRLEDDRFVYRWDWRGQLVSVTVKAAWPDGTLLGGAPDGELDISPYAGHRVRYDYDARGRLTRRLHEGVGDGSGVRPFIELRELVWEGDRLAAEAAYGAPDGTNFRWRRTYVPGPAGLDDPPQVTVEIQQPGSPFSGIARTYTYLRDELGTVIGLVAEDEGSDPQSPPVPLRYRYTPYGEAHAETGPELLRARFDSGGAEVAGAGGTVTQVVADPASAAAGGMVLDWSLPLDAASLGAVAVEELVPGAGWTAVDPGRVAIGEAPEAEGAGVVSENPRLVVLLTDGWTRGRSYRVRLAPGLADRLGRPFGRNESLEWSVPAAGPDPEAPPPVSFDRRFPTVYETFAAAGDTAGGRFPAGQSRLFQGLWTDPVTGTAYARARWYDPRNGVFLTEDPMDDVDSPNLYAFVGWMPSMGTDPMGLYAESGHYYTVLYAALRAGYRADEAAQLAFHAQAPDEIAHYDAMENYFDAKREGMSNLKPGPDSTEAREHMEINHPAVHSLTGGVSVTETDRAIEGVLDAPNLAAAGVQLHRLGDSFAHRQVGNEAFLYETGVGHASDGTTPDTIQRRTDLYGAYVTTLTATLAKRRGATQAEANALGAEVSQELSVVAAIPANDTDAWYKHKLVENAELQAASNTALRGLISNLGRQRGEQSEIDRILNYRPEAADAEGVTSFQLIQNYLRTQGNPDPKAPGFSAQGVGRAFNYAHELYESQRPR
jgi:RHS repeat-associated protein